MKKISTLFCYLMITSTQTVFAENSICQSNNGVMRCGPGTVNELNYRGYVDIDGTTITDYFDVLGQVDADNAYINRFHVRGQTQLRKTNITTLMEVNGDVRANDIVVSSPMTIIGSLYAGHGTFASSVNLTGTIHCDTCLFNDKTFIVGNIKINNSEFAREITMTISNAFFSNSKLKDIHVMPTNDNNEEQAIYLKENTLAQNIKFDSGKGVVFVSNGSRIMGTVTGGKIINQ